MDNSGEHSLLPILPVLQVFKLCGLLAAIVGFLMCKTNKNNFISHIYVENDIVQEPVVLR